MEWEAILVQEQEAEAGLCYWNESSSMPRMIHTWGNIGYNQKESVSQVTSHREWEERQGDWEEARSRIGIGGMTLGGASRKYLNEGWWLVRDIGVIRGSRDHWNEEEREKRLILLQAPMKGMVASTLHEDYL